MLFPIAQGLSQGKFNDPNDPNVGFLNELVRLNPEATRQAISLETRDVESSQQRAFQQIINELAANNQLESSVTGNRLADLQQDYGRNIEDINSKYYLADVDRALANTSDLFKTGLGLGSDIRGGALQNQSQTNEFNLANFQNQVTADMLNKPVATRGGFGGALTGALGGGLTGFMLGGPVGAAIGAGAGGLAGGFGSPQTGGQLSNLGGMSLGLGRSSNAFSGATPSFLPGSSASSDPFGRLSARNIGLSSGDPLLDKFGFGLGAWN